MSSILAARLGRARTIHEDRVLSLRFHWETNYFHFLNDLLPRLRLAEAHGIEKDVPVVVAERLARQPFFRSSFPDGYIAGRRVIVQERDTFLSCEEVTFANAGTASSANAAFVAELLEAPDPPSGTRRLFLDRAPSRGRFLSNRDALLPILERHQLEIIDSDTLTVPEQVTLFSSAELIVGIHGAGLANMIFRSGARCSVVEIFPPSESPGWFYHLSRALGFDYAPVRGHGDGPAYDRRLPFSVAPAALEAPLERATRLGADCAPV